MAMSKKDYVAIAAAISGERMPTPKVMQPGDKDALSVHHNTLDLISRSIANVCERSNPRFDRARFLTACGVE